jgi:membrane protease YdiL (CAAX protease family)
VRRFAIAILVVGVWLAITILGDLALVGHGALATLVSQQITLATPAAALFLWLAARHLGWRDIGLNGARPARSILLLWPIGVYIAFFAGVANVNHPAALPAIGFVAINTFFVGVSEELAFRGVLWGGARQALPFWPGLLLVSALFGSVHLLNALITGDLVAAGIQALNACLSGFGYLAMRIRTRSLFPIMIGHWLWDLAVFISTPAPGQPAPNPLPWYSGAVLVAPIALYGLWLLRKREFRVISDD